VIGIDATDAILCSAKTGLGVDDVLEAVIARIPPPKGDPAAPLKALIIDSWFDNYVGVVMLVRVVDGTLRAKDKILLMAEGSQHLCEQVGVFTPKSVTRPELRAGEVGFIISGIKELDAAKVGDTVTIADRRAAGRCPASRKSSRRSSPASTRSNPTSTTACATRWKSSSSTTPRCTTSRKSRRRSASASAAASSACCTWKSCRNAWSASSTRT
jgi:translation initiation factor IF-2